MNYKKILESLGEAIVAELPMDVPPSDFIITKPYLFYYAKSESISDIEKNGISPNDSNTRVFAFFCRIPQTLEKYKSFLEEYMPVKISVNKLNRAEDKCRVYAVNFPKVNSDRKLSAEEIEKLCDQEDKFYHLFNKLPLNKVPCAGIEFDSGVVEPFVFKVIDSDDEATK